ncbi:hypothetical protein GPECTOR_628g723 [Gonium pectorale]|uniref:Protein kinase domain-containing protein n=1 Tax=Gonium pectorale TaxID=33097 RepID=A0A150FUE4_GONPE|nr:hypothetical protein GPECTOR_628g723 [Gonium pectorale]|eukprot:KXZ41234.1 hypothetical protein GPECTOR_628g723 [Gonium pectorale]
MSNNAALVPLAVGFMDEQRASRLLEEIENRVKTSTKRAALSDRGYIFGERLGSPGQACSSMYYVYKGAGVYCGKVYNPGEAASMEHEAAVSEAVHRDQTCPTLIKVIDAFRAGRHAVLILPLLARSAADLLAATDFTGIDDEAAAYVCAGVLAAMAGLASKGWCHGDIKPANIMLAGDENRVVLVDLGACTRMHERLAEFTEHYGLGLPRFASLRYDLACLASTLCTLAGVMMTGDPSARELSAHLADCDCSSTGEGSLSLGGQIALHILEHLDGVDTVQQLREEVWDKVMERVRDRLGEEHAATLAAWWP